MLRDFAVASLAVVGLLTAAVLPAEAGANTGTWRYWTRTLRLRTGRTRAGIWVAAIIIVGTTAIAKDIMGAPIGARQAGESHSETPTPQRAWGTSRPMLACVLRSEYVGIDSRRHAGVTKAAPVVQRLQRRIACLALRWAEFTKRRVAEHEPWAGSLRRRCGRS
jgi:hypothetical protein